MTDPRFSLVVPCYNESAGLAELVRRCRFVAAEGDGEVILVDNGSSDDTPAQLEAELGAAAADPVAGQVRWIRVEVNQGYGFGIVSGLRAATTAPVIGWTHADLQTDPADVLRAMPAFDDGAPRVIVKGRRYGRPVADRVFTAGMSVFETVLMRTRLTDVNAQPTLFHRELMDLWGDPPDDFALDVFALYQAVRNGFAVRRLPVIFAPRKFGSSHWNTDFRAKKRFIERTVKFSLALRRRS